VKKYRTWNKISIFKQDSVEKYNITLHIMERYIFSKNATIIIKCGTQQ